jgi:hypothetical protein
MTRIRITRQNLLGLGEYYLVAFKNEKKYCMLRRKDEDSAKTSYPLGCREGWPESVEFEDSQMVALFESWARFRKYLIACADQEWVRVTFYFQKYY